MRIKILRLLLFKTTILSFKDFMQEQNLKRINMIEKDLKKII